MALGMLLVVASAACFALAAVWARMGMRTRSGDDGLFMSALVNVITLGMVVPFVRLPAWSGVGIAAFVLAGLLGTWLGRFAQLRAVRMIGAARSNAYMGSAPVFAAITGWLVLGERVTIVQGAGGVVVGAGLVLLSRSGSALPAAAGEGGAGGPKPVLGASPEGAPFRPRAGLWYALVAPVMFGQAFVVRKLGLVHYPSPVIGALLGASSSLAVVVGGASLFGRLPRLLEDNVRRIPWLFVAAGGAMSAALLFQFASYLLLPAWMVGVLAGTSAMWALLWSRLFLGREDAISGRLVGAVVLVVGGVCLMAINP